MSKKINVYSNGSYKISEEILFPYIKKDIPIYGYVVHDYEFRGVSRPTFNNAPDRIFGLPETVETGNPDGKGIKLTEELQLFWYKMNKKAYKTDQQNKDEWSSLTRDNAAFTNFHGSLTCADYINRSNLDKQPMELFPLLCGGAYIKIIDGIGTGTYTFETISTTEDFNKYNIKTHPHLFFYGVTSRREKIYEFEKGRRLWKGKWDEKFAVPFYQFDGAIVPIMSFGKKYNTVSSSRVRILPIDSPIPSPFVFD